MAMSEGIRELSEKERKALRKELQKYTDLAFESDARMDLSDEGSEEAGMM
ncbi:hypothetical protein KGO95_01315 [Patescibacteria group bacterium]|nr:hypothetical protein [Patescibacteria group bacterium]